MSIDLDSSRIIAERRPLVSIAIAHYDTPDLIRVCLRALKQFSQGSYEILIIDNGSTNPASLSYLRALGWIRLFERPPSLRPGGRDHAAALDLALEEATGEYLLVMHSDTIVRSADWLQTLLQPFGDHQVAVVGAGKPEVPGSVRKLLRALGDWRTYASLVSRVGWTPSPACQPRPVHPRSYCSVYRRSILLREQLNFLSGRPAVTGEGIYQELLCRGYRGVIIPDCQMRELVFHIGHATSYLAAGRSVSTRRVRRRTGRRIREFMSSPFARELLEDSSLDR